MKALSVVGARPNFMKLFPVARALARRPDVAHVVVHTGQHYDPLLSDQLFADLQLPTPDHHLGVGSGSQAAQTAAAMVRLEPLLERERPDVVLVYGDVNSTLAAALVAAKLGLRIAHVEAGLRSDDRTMPEEINRLVTDRLSDLLLAPSDDAVDHLLAEGTPADRVRLVGNVMIDTLIATLPRARALDAPGRHRVAPGGYVVATLHRPANVDDPATLAALMATLGGLARDLPVLFPVHPRTRARIQELGGREGDGLRLLPPVGYLEMLGLVTASAAVITDSGGLQEETTFLGVPCVTVRPSTERPITCRLGTNRLARPDRGSILHALRAGMAERGADPPRIPYWDGGTGERIAEILCGPRADAEEPAAMAGAASAG